MSDHTLSPHKLLERQLKKCNLTTESTPIDSLAWQNFLDKVNKSYMSSDQDRYLLERSMEISSKELILLNKEMSMVQSLAKIGYWYHDPEINHNSLSRELYNMLEIPIDTKISDIDIIADLIHEPDKHNFMNCLKNLIANGQRFCLEAKIASYSNPASATWYSIEGYKTNQSEISNTVVLILIDIDARKQADITIDSLNKQLVMSARRAGMADVATSVLHNMGNILNSANVSINILSDQLTGLSNKRIDDVEAIIFKESETIEHFIKTNNKAGIITEYLLNLNKLLINCCREMLVESKQLRDHIEHLKEITNMQKLIGNSTDIIENLFTPELIEHAFKMSKQAYRYADTITFEIDIKDKPFILSDKSKILQILINLICNAYESLLESNQEKKHIDIKLYQPQEDLIAIAVIDNGIGISPENLINIFTFGFTTKKTGHGFGLHSSAITAKELGGELTAQSDGSGTGACFTLTLPINKMLRKA